MFRKIRYSKYAEPSLSGMTLRPSLERVIMRYASVGLTSFLVALLAFSIFAPVETTDATGEILMALNSANSSISLSTSSGSNPIDLSLTAGSDGAVRTASDVVTVVSGSAGYQLYIGMNGTSNALIRDGATSTGTDANTGAPTYANTDLIPASLITNIASPNTLSNDTWGFAVPARNTTSGSGSEDVVEGTGFGDASTYPVGDNSVATSKFIAVPTHGNDLLVAKRSTTTPSAGVNTNFYYGVRATSAKPSGLYRNTVTYTAIGDGNVSGLASVSPSRTNQLGGGETLTIATPSTLELANISSIDITVGGATCTNPSAVKNNNGAGPLVNLTCTSPALATGWHEVVANINTTAGSTETYVVNPGIEYYLDEGGSQVAVYMQDFTIADCAKIASLESITLQDSRDNNIYRVTKQADGNCWMSDNLRLGTTPDGKGIQGVTLNSANSDIPTNGTPFTINASDILKTGDAYTNWQTIDNWEANHIFSFAGTDNAKTYGNLYNWYTATASTGLHSSFPTSINASASICPKGWQLPNNTGNGSFTQLMLSTTATNSISTATSGTNDAYVKALQGLNSDGTVNPENPLSFVLSGGYGSSPGGQGVYGLYWSRTSHSSNTDGSMDLYFNNSNGDFVLQHGGSKYNGFAVRCVLVMPTSMQNLTSSMCSNMKTAQTLTLKDSRDQNEYSVTKQADGNCWMTQNLRLGTTSDGTGTQNVTLTTTDSNITGPDITIPASAIQTSGGSWWGGTVDTYHIYARTSTDATANGNFYNWYTATASSGNANITTLVDVPMSICPSGWRLPQHRSYLNLMQKAVSTDIGYGNHTNTAYVNAFQATPLSFTMSGYYNNNLTDNGAHYWSSTASSVASHAFNFTFYDSGLFSVSSGDVRYFGFSVRCVFIP